VQAITRVAFPLCLVPRLVNAASYAQPIFYPIPKTQAVCVSCNSSTSSFTSAGPPPAPATLARPIHSASAKRFWFGLDVAALDFAGRGVTRATADRGLYLHLRQRPMGRAHAPPHLPAASRVCGEEAKELVLAPVRLDRHRTQWPCDQLGPPGPSPAHPSCPLDPWGAGWGEISALLAAWSPSDPT
jgi:hypothetical protein